MGSEESAQIAVGCNKDSDIAVEGKKPTKSGRKRREDWQLLMTVHSLN